MGILDIRCSTDPSFRTHGFTLIEILVSISVILVLLAILQPALRLARESARRTQCLVTLKEIGVASEMMAAANGGWWFGSSPDEEPYIFDGMANTSHLIRPLSRAVWWQVQLDGILWNREETSESRYRADPNAICCPSILSAYEREFAWEQPDYISARSYVFSPALLTTPGVWSPENHTQRRDLPSHTKRFRMADVRSPSAKVALIETADHHAEGAALGKGAARANALLADLSARTAVTNQMRAGLELLWPSYGYSGNQALTPGETTTAPGLGTEGGAFGRDF